MLPVWEANDDCMLTAGQLRGFAPAAGDPSVVGLPNTGASSASKRFSNWSSSGFAK